MAWVRATSWPGRCCSAATPSDPSTCRAHRPRPAPTWTRPDRCSRWPPRRCSAARPRSGWPPSSRRADACSCTGFCRRSTTTAPTARCSRTRSAWPPAPGSRARRTTSRPCGRPDWAGDQPEVRVGVLQRLEPTGATEVEPLVDGRRGRVAGGGGRAPAAGRPCGRRGLRLPVPPRLLARAAGSARRTPPDRDGGRHPRAAHDHDGRCRRASDCCTWSTSHPWPSGSGPASAALPLPAAPSSSCRLAPG